MDVIAQAIVKIGLGVEVEFEKDGIPQVKWWPIKEPQQFDALYTSLFDLTIGAAKVHDIKHPLYGCDVKGFTMQVKRIEEEIQDGQKKQQQNEQNEQNGSQKQTERDTGKVILSP